MKEVPPEIVEAKEYLENELPSDQLIISTGGDFHGDRGTIGETTLTEKEWELILTFLEREVN